MAKSKDTNQYKPSEIEAKWQKYWVENAFYQAKDPPATSDVAPSGGDKKKKFYVLIEFPYPSGAGLHVGHVRSWSAMDAYARKKRMEGFNVLYPIGWDAFGLPAENYAIKNKIHPSVAVSENIASFKRQIKSLGLSFDWEREVNTTDPNYYKWTQWIFLKFLKKGLAYQADVPVNWCPVCKTTLADEEVLPNGTHERCGNPTQKRMQKQWLLAITKYADRLLEDLKTVDYPEMVAQQQVNWIGRSEGVKVTFETNHAGLQITVFTTALDTIFGTTFMVLSPEYANKLMGYVPEDKKKTVTKYIKESLNKSEIDRQNQERAKTGVDIGILAVNSFNGRQIPVFVADYVLAGYGTGAVMGVPGHDARDYDFAKKYTLPIIPVIKPVEGKMKDAIKADGFWNYTEIKEHADKAVLFNSDHYDGLISKEAKAKLEDALLEKGIGEKVVSYHLRDWVFSRQHYWGEPIPIMYCRTCWELKVQSSKFKVEGRDYRIIDGKEYVIVPVPEKDLPVELPYLEKYEPSGTGESPLANVTAWVNVSCPTCGKPARRETDTMPNWAGSNWYFLAYLFANKLGDQKSKIKNQRSKTEKNDNIFSSNKDVIDHWMPVDIYQGGFEHTTLHLLYSRFVYKFLFDLGVVPTPEPYAKRRVHGIVLGPDGKKMSKSFGNVMNPDDIVKKFGADTLRIYEMFMGPFDQTIAWSEASVEGCFRFLKRIWHLGTTKTSAKQTSRELLGKLHKTIKKVDADMERMKFNTAVSAMMELVNAWQTDKGGLSPQDLKQFLLILSPFAPHMTEELWNKLKVESGKLKMNGQKKLSTLNSQFSIHLQRWPKADISMLQEEEVTIVVQVNGRVRDTIKVQSSKFKVQSQKEVEQLAKESAKVQKYLAGKEIKKVVYVEGKLINFVT